MAAHYPDEDLLRIFEEAKLIFNSWNMPKTVEQVQILLDESKRSQIHASYYNFQFKEFQTMMEAEFGTTTYRKKIAKYVLGNLRVAMSVYIDHVIEMNKVKDMVDLVYDRINANRVFSALNKILLKGSESEYEKMIGLSYAYSALAEGAYKQSVRDFYLWEHLANGNLQVEKVPEILTETIGGIIKYYNENSIDKSIFEGYKNTIRNGIAHSTMYFNENTNQMRYKDKKKEIVLDRNGLYELFTKIQDVYLLALAKNQLLRINDACVNLRDRKRI
jgi:hypothetical protein